MESIKIKSNARKSTYSGRPNAAHQEQLRMRQALKLKSNANRVPVKSSPTTWKSPGWSLSARVRQGTRDELLTPMVVANDKESIPEAAALNSDMSSGSGNVENGASSEKKSPDQRSLWSLFSAPKEKVDENASQVDSITNGSGKSDDDHLTPQRVKRAPSRDPRIRKREESKAELTKKISPTSFNLLSKMKPLKSASRNFFAHLGKKPDVSASPEVSATSEHDRVTLDSQNDASNAATEHRDSRVGKRATVVSRNKNLKDIRKKSSKKEENYEQNCNILHLREQARICSSTRDKKENSVTVEHSRMKESGSKTRNKRGENALPDTGELVSTNQNQDKDASLAEDATSGTASPTKLEEGSSKDIAMPTLTLPAEIEHKRYPSNVSSELDDSECLFIDEQAHADSPSDNDEDSSKVQDEEESHVLRVWSLQSEGERNSDFQDVDLSSSFGGDANSSLGLDDSLPSVGNESLNSFGVSKTESDARFVERLHEVEKSGALSKSCSERILETANATLRNADTRIHRSRSLEEGPPKLQAQPNTHHLLQELDSLLESSTFQSDSHSNMQHEAIEHSNRNLEASQDSKTLVEDSEPSNMQYDEIQGTSGTDSLNQTEESGHSNATESARNIFSLFGSAKKPLSPKNIVKLQIDTGNPYSSSYLSASSKDSIVLSGSCSGERNKSTRTKHTELNTANTLSNNNAPDTGLPTLSFRNESHDTPGIFLSGNNSSDHGLPSLTNIKSPGTSIPSLTPETGTGDGQGSRQKDIPPQNSQPPELCLEVNPSSLGEREASLSSPIFPAPDEENVDNVPFLAFETRDDLVSYSKAMKLKMQRKPTQTNKVPSKKCVYPAVKNVKMKKRRKNPMEAKIKALEQDLLWSMESKGLTEIVHPVLSRKGVALDAVKKNDLVVNVRNEELERLSYKKPKHKKKHRSKSEIGHTSHARGHGRHSNFVGLSRHRHFSSLQVRKSSIDKDCKKEHAEKPSDTGKVVGLKHGHFPDLQKSISKVQSSEQSKKETETKRSEARHQEWAVCQKELHAPSERPSLKLKLVTKAKSTSPTKVEQSPLALSTKPRESTVPVKSPTSHIPVNVQQLQLPSSSAVTKSTVPQPSARLPVEESLPFKPFEKPVASKKSAFVSDALEDLLQGVGMNNKMKPLISPSTISVSNAKVVFKVPSRQSHSVKTLDMALKRQKPLNVASPSYSSLLLKDSHNEHRGEKKKKKKKKKEKHKDKNKYRIKDGFVFGTGPDDLVRKLPKLPFTSYGKSFARPLFARERQDVSKVGDKSQGFLDVRNVLSLSDKATGKRQSDEAEVQGTKNIKQEPEESNEDRPYADENLPSILNMNLSPSGKDGDLLQEESNIASKESKSEEGQAPSETKVGGKCKEYQEYCRLGCICSNLDEARPVQELSNHCRKVDCMFDCICKKSSSQSVTGTRIRRPPTHARDMLFYDESYKFWRVGDPESTTGEVKKMQLLDHLPESEKRNLVSSCARTRHFITDKPDKWIKLKRKQQGDEADQQVEKKRAAVSNVAHPLASESSKPQLTNSNRDLQHGTQRIVKQQKSHHRKKEFIPLIFAAKDRKRGQVSDQASEAAYSKSKVKNIPYAEMTAPLSLASTSSQGQAPEGSTFLPVSKQYLLNGNLMNMVMLPNGNRILIPASCQPATCEPLSVTTAMEQSKPFCASEARRPAPKVKCAQYETSAIPVQVAQPIKNTSMQSSVQNEDGLKLPTAQIGSSVSSVTSGHQRAVLPVRFELTSSGIVLKPGVEAPATAAAPVSSKGTEPSVQLNVARQALQNLIEKEISTAVPAKTCLVKPRVKSNTCVPLATSSKKQDAAASLQEQEHSATKSVIQVCSPSESASHEDKEEIDSATSKAILVPGSSPGKAYAASNIHDKSQSVSDSGMETSKKLSSSLPGFDKLSEIVRRTSVDDDDGLSPVKKLTRNVSDWLHNPKIQKPWELQNYTGVKGPWFTTENEGVKVVLQRNKDKRSPFGKGGKSPIKPTPQTTSKRPSTSPSPVLSPRKSAKGEKTAFQNTMDNDPDSCEGKSLAKDEGEASENVHFVAMEHNKKAETPVNEIFQTSEESVEDKAEPFQELITRTEHLNKENQYNLSETIDLLLDSNAISIVSTCNSQIDNKPEKGASKTLVDTSNNSEINEKTVIGGLSEQQSKLISSGGSDPPKAVSPSPDANIDDEMDAEGEIGIADAEGTLGIEHFARFSEEDAYRPLDVDEEVPCSFDLPADCNDDDNSSVASLKIYEGITNDISNADLGMSTSLPKDHIQETSETPEAKGDTQENLPSPAASKDRVCTDLTDPPQKDSRSSKDESNYDAGILLHTENTPEVPVVGESLDTLMSTPVIPEHVPENQPSLAEDIIQTETTPMRNPTVHPKKSLIMNIKFVATSNENCTSPICSSPSSEVLSENTQDGSPTPVKDNDLSDAGPSETDNFTSTICTPPVCPSPICMSPSSEVLSENTQDRSPTLIQDSDPSDTEVDVVNTDDDDEDVDVESVVGVTPAFQNLNPYSSLRNITSRLSSTLRKEQAMDMEQTKIKPKSSSNLRKEQAMDMEQKKIKPNSSSNLRKEQAMDMEQKKIKPNSSSNPPFKLSIGHSFGSPTHIKKHKSSSVYRAPMKINSQVSAIAPVKHKKKKSKRKSPVCPAKQWDSPHYRVVYTEQPLVIQEEKEEEEEVNERMSNHNHLERLRREELRKTFLGLSDAVRGSKEHEVSAEHGLAHKRVPPKIHILKQAVAEIKKLTIIEKELLMEKELFQKQQRRLVYVHSNLLHHARCNGQIIFPEGSRLAESMDRIRAGLSKRNPAVPPESKHIQDSSTDLQGKGRVRKAPKNWEQTLGSHITKKDSSAERSGNPSLVFKKKKSKHISATSFGSKDIQDSSADLTCMGKERKASKTFEQFLDSRIRKKDSSIERSSDAYADFKKKKSKKKSHNRHSEKTSSSSLKTAFGPYPTSKDPPGFNKYLNFMPLTKKDLKASLSKSQKEDQESSIDLSVPSGSGPLSHGRYGVYSGKGDHDSSSNEEESLPIDCYVSSSDEPWEDDEGEEDYGMDYDEEPYSDDGFIPESEDEDTANDKRLEKSGAFGSDGDKKKGESEQDIVTINIDLDDFEQENVESRSDSESSAEFTGMKRVMPKVKQMSHRKEKSYAESADSDDDVLVIAEEAGSTNDKLKKKENERGTLKSLDGRTVLEGRGSQNVAKKQSKTDRGAKKVSSIPSVSQCTLVSKTSQDSSQSTQPIEPQREGSGVKQNKAPLVNVIDEIMNRLTGGTLSSGNSSAGENTDEALGPSRVGFDVSASNSDVREKGPEKLLNKSSTSAVLVTDSIQSKDRQSSAVSLKPEGDVSSSGNLISTAVGLASNSIHRKENYVSETSLKHSDDEHPSGVTLHDSDSSSADDVDNQESTSALTATAANSIQHEEGSDTGLYLKQKEHAQARGVMLDDSEDSSVDEVDGQQSTRASTAMSLNDSYHEKENSSPVGEEESVASTSHSKFTASVSNDLQRAEEKNSAVTLQKKTGGLQMTGALAALISRAKTRVENDDSIDSSDDSESEEEEEDEDSDDGSKNEESSDEEEMEVEKEEYNVAEYGSGSNDSESKQQDITDSNKDDQLHASEERDQSGKKPEGSSVDQKIPESFNSAVRNNEEMEHRKDTSADEAAKDPLFVVEEKDQGTSKQDQSSIGDGSTGPPFFAKAFEGEKEIPDGFSVGEDVTDDDAACLSYAAMGNDEDHDEALFDAGDPSPPSSPISLDMNIASDDDIEDTADEDPCAPGLQPPRTSSIAGTSTDETKSRPQEMSSRAEPSSLSLQDSTLDEAISFLDIEKNSDGTLNVLLKGDYDDEKLDELFEKPGVMDYIMTAAAKKP
eukprot:XP_011683525.1 PREDICTED: uncharacterized protein LOC757118 isoform X2 [Strongylocentrotus purpuratus]